MSIFNSIMKDINYNIYSKNLFELNGNIINDIKTIIEINDDIINKVISIINHKYFPYTDNSFLGVEKKTKELEFLKRKRRNEHFKLKVNNDYIFQKESRFTISNRNKKIEYIKLQDESGNFKRTPQSNSINTTINKYEKKIISKINCESAEKSNPKENNKILNIRDDVKNETINHSSKSKNLLPKLIYFNIKKIVIKNDYLDLNTNNEIKVFKNNKIVYINKYLLNSPSYSRDIKKINKINFIIGKQRTSKYRGVSKNGNKWQVLMMINKKNCYCGSYPTEELAARIYDIQAIKNWGVKAKTNFTYNNIQIKKIFEKKINLKSNNLSDIIAQIIN